MGSHVDSEDNEPSDDDAEESCSAEIAHRSTLLTAAGFLLRLLARLNRDAPNQQPPSMLPYVPEFVQLKSFSAERTDLLSTAVVLVADVWEEEVANDIRLSRGLSELKCSWSLVQFSSEPDGSLVKGLFQVTASI